MNKRLQAFQDALAKPGNGIKDAVRVKQSQVQAFKDSADLNTHLAAACDDFIAKCLAACRGIPSGDGKSAAANCQDEAKAAAAFRNQADRDQAQVKRAERAK